MHHFVTLFVHHCFTLRVQHLIVLRFHTPICGNRLRALWLSAQHFAAAEALPMLMPDEPEVVSCPERIRNLAPPAGNPFPAEQ